MGKFKVGDRVIAKGRGYGGGEHEGKVVEIDDTIALVEFSDGWSGGHDGGRGDNVKNRWNFLHRDLRQAPLKLEAGKFYKTRDGRKVGPMQRHAWASGYFEMPAKLTSQSWYEDGSYIKGLTSQLDLISEWIEPKVNVAAQVDTLSDEYGRGSVTPAPSNDNVAKPKFKVGDRVENLRGSKDYIGAKGTIIEDDGSTMPYKIKLDQPIANWGDTHLWSNADGIKLLSSHPTAIVALIEDGQPKPAARPYIHDTVEAATTEANRLAAKHKGQEFGVYVLNGTFQVPKPAYDHEWQRLAAAGQKINAIKELRAITGLGLKPTKDAVEYWLATEHGLATAA